MTGTTQRKKTEFCPECGKKWQPMISSAGIAAKNGLTEAMRSPVVSMQI
jgi:hypothetical protein